jgi:hypothetical protein
MKSVTFILLIVLAFTVLAPVTSLSFMAVNDGRSFLGTLDVCHSAAPALSSNGEMPCVGLAPCTAPPTLSVSFTEPVHPVFTELILTSSSEHPPRS